MLAQLGHSAELRDLIARLEKLAPQTAVSLAVHVKDQRSRTQEDREAKPIEEGDFKITADSKAVTVSVTGKLSDTRVFEEFSVLRAGSLAHYAPHLARDLKGLKLMEKRPDTQQDIACERWHLQSEVKQSQFGIKTTTLRKVDLWLDVKGFPLRASFKTQVNGRMLLFKFSSVSTRSQRYKRIGERLVLVFDESKTDTTSKAGTEKQTITTTAEINES